MGNIKIITKEIAENWPVTNPESFTQIEDSAAETLARRGGMLNLGGLTSLSDNVAAALAKHYIRSLDLSGLTSLSDKAAEALANHSGTLDLSRLRSLSDKAAEALKKNSWFFKN